MRIATRSMFATALLVLGFAGAAFAAAAGIDGKWSGSLNGPDGPVPVLLDVKAADGGALTGSATLFGMTTALSNGKTDGSDVSFDLVLGDGAFTLPFKGKLDGDKLTLTIATPMGSSDVVFTRAPAS